MLNLHFRWTVVALGCLLLASGCADTNYRNSTPNVDQHFGYAVNAAKAQQTINPDASLNTDPVAGIDGEAANDAIDRYHESFRTPPPTTTVINIGGGITGQ